MLYVITTTDLLLAVCIMFGAALYSSVGHAGASSYIAFMALFGVQAAVMRSKAVVLDINVATLASARLMRAGLFRWRTLWPFLLGAMPLAFLSGMIQLPGHLYRPIVGVVLLCSGSRLLWRRELKAATERHDPPAWLVIVCGAGIGLLSGLTGTGGRILLSPLLLFLARSAFKPASGVAAAFILFNSVSGLLGNLSPKRSLPPELPLFAGAVLVVGVIGTTLGILLATPLILRCLGVVMVVAGAKPIGAY